MARLPAHILAFLGALWLVTPTWAQTPAQDESGAFDGTLATSRPAVPDSKYTAWLDDYIARVRSVGECQFHIRRVESNLTRIQQKKANLLFAPIDRVRIGRLMAELHEHNLKLKKVTREIANGRSQLAQHADAIAPLIARRIEVLSSESPSPVPGAERDMEILNELLTFLEQRAATTDRQAWQIQEALYNVALELERRIEAIDLEFSRLQPLILPEEGNDVDHALSLFDLLIEPPASPVPTPSPSPSPSPSPTHQPGK